MEDLTHIMAVALESGKRTWISITRGYDRARIKELDKLNEELRVIGRFYKNTRENTLYRL